MHAKRDWRHRLARFVTSIELRGVGVKRVQCMRAFKHWCGVIIEFRLAARENAKQVNMVHEVHYPHPNHTVPQNAHQYCPSFI